MAMYLLTSVAPPTAPMPPILPTYRVACTTGEMSGVRARFEVSASGQGASRRGEIKIDGVVVSFGVESRPITLLYSVGGTGFVDTFHYLRGDFRESIMLSVRGEIADELMTVYLHRQPATAPHEPAYALSGVCHLVGDSVPYQERLQ